MRRLTKASLKKFSNLNIEELAGLRGTMHIVIDKGNHSYEFEYDFPDG
jgi:hypothetical protein